MSSLMWKTDVIARCAMQYRSQSLAKFGLKSCHASYLLHIYQNPGVSQEKLAQAIFLNKSSVARQLASLEEDGFVRRVSCERDRRIICLYVTDKTEALIPEIEKILGIWEDVVTEDLTEEERKVLSALLDKMWDSAAAFVEQD